MRVSLLVIAATLLSTHPALARPEYAAKEKQSCVACHETPWGGGPRTVFGKSYGNFGMTGSTTSVTDLFSGDLRTIAYFTPSTSQRSSGVASMEAAASANVPVVSGDEQTEMRLVATYNIAPLSGSNLREGYARFALPSGSTYFLVGHFYLPFGLLTDEHRTYTRLQSVSTENDFATGGAMAVDLAEPLHLDVALVNDLQSGGSLTTKDFTWAGVLNLRWNPVSLPFLLGVSADYEHTIKSDEPVATSLYGVLSVDRLTNAKVHGSVQLERVDAKNWNNPAVNSNQVNPSLDAFFIPEGDSSYLSSVARAHSMGYYGLVRWDAFSHLSFIYKLDWLALDWQATRDAFVRHGLGFRAYLNSNLYLDARYELTSVGRKDIASSSVLGAQNDFFAMLRLWL